MGKCISSFATFIAGCVVQTEGHSRQVKPRANSRHSYSRAVACKIRPFPGFPLISPVIWNKHVLSWACVLRQSWLQNLQLLCWPRSWPRALQESWGPDSSLSPEPLGFAHSRPAFPQPQVWSLQHSKRAETLWNLAEVIFRIFPGSNPIPSPAPLPSWYKPP